MNEERILELLKQLVGGDSAFEWVGKQMGKGIYKSYDTTHKAAHAVVGGMAVMGRNTVDFAHEAKEEFQKGYYGFDKKLGPSKDPQNELDQKIEAALNGYGLNKGEKKFCANRIAAMAEELKEVMNKTPGTEKEKEAAGMRALDKAIKENVEFYGAMRALQTKGDKGLDAYYKDDVAKKEAFITKAEFTLEYDKLKQAKMDANPVWIKEAEDKLKQKAVKFAMGWDRTEAEQQKTKAHFSHKM